jgi:hypothetical protein
MIPSRLVGLMAAAAVTMIPAVSLADDLTIPLTVGISGTPGDVLPLGSTEVDASLVGRTCSVTYAGHNNESVHPGTDLYVSSGESQAVLSGVEDFAGKTTIGSSSLTLGPSVSVSVKVGSDGVASLGASLTFMCTAPPNDSVPEETLAPTTTVPPTTSTTSTTSTTTTMPSTTTTTVPLLIVPPVAFSPTTAPAIVVQPPEPIAVPIVAPGDELPATGSNGGTNIGATALAVGALGVFLVALSRRRGSATDRG